MKKSKEIDEQKWLKMAGLTLAIILIVFGGVDNFVRTLKFAMVRMLES